MTRQVIGLLQRILEDAELELKEAEAAERKAEAEHKTFLKEQKNWLFGPFFQ